MRTTSRLRVGGEKAAGAAGDGHETDEIAAVGVRRTVDTKAVAKAVAGEAARCGW